MLIIDYAYCHFRGITLFEVMWSASLIHIIRLRFNYGNGYIAHTSNFDVAISLLYKCYAMSRRTIRACIVHMSSLLAVFSVMQCGYFPEI